MVTVTAEPQNGQANQYGVDMNGEAHESAYRGFVSFTTISTLTLVIWVLCLAIGGVKHAWGWALTGIALSFVAAAIAALLRKNGWKVPAILAVFMTLVFLFQ